eukprot:3260100-Pyramimonas_sp.AAC.1
MSWPVWPSDEETRLEVADDAKGAGLCVDVSAWACRLQYLRPPSSRLRAGKQREGEPGDQPDGSSEWCTARWSRKCE